MTPSFLGWVVLLRLQENMRLVLQLATAELGYRLQSQIHVDVKISSRHFFFITGYALFFLKNKLAAKRERGRKRERERDGEKRES